LKNKKIISQIEKTPVYNYASNVLSGKIVANEYIKIACKDFIDELNDPNSKYIFSYKSLKLISNDYLLKTNRAFYIGRGIDHAVSLEAALKLKEISYIQCEGFASGELKHGTIALIEEGTPVIGFITQEKTAGLTRSNLQETMARGAKTLTIVREGLAVDGDDLILPDVDEMLMPLLSVVPAQLLAYYTSLNKGLDVDKPRNLAKSVTVE